MIHQNQSLLALNLVVASGLQNHASVTVNVKSSGALKLIRQIQLNAVMKIFMRLVNLDVSSSRASQQVNKLLTSPSLWMANK